MKNKRSISVLMMFFFITFSIMSGMSYNVFAEPTTTNVKIPKLVFTQKPYAEYVSGSKVEFKVAATTEDGAKVQVSAKLYNLDKSLKVMDVMNYGKAYVSAEQVPMSMTIKDPGNYRIAVYTRVNGTVGITKSYYDNYITQDFKISKPAVEVKPVVLMDLIKIYTEIGSAYKLPVKLSGKTSSGQVKQFSVKWDKTVSTVKAGTFKFVGTLTEVGKKTPLTTVKANLSMVVYPVPTFATTTAAIDLYGEFKLPDKINGKLKDGTLKEYAVTWDKKVNTTTVGAVTFNGAVKNLTTNLVLKNVKPKLVLTVNPFPVFDPIVATADVFSTYKLPDTMTGKLVDGKTKQFPVEWDKDVSTQKPGSTTYVGTVAYPDTKIKLKNVKVILTLNVKEVPVFEQISASVVEGAEYVMPATVIGKLSNGSNKTYNVTWNGKASTALVGVFSFDGVIKDPTTGIVVPIVKATLKLTVNPMKPEVLSAKASNTKSFLLTFNRNIDTAKCKIAVTMNDIAIPVTANWQSDAKSVLLQSTTELAWGTYVIKMSGLDMSVDSFKVDVQKATLATISIPTVFITPNNAAAKILVAGKDQYGQAFDVSAEDFTWLVTDTTLGRTLQVAVSKENYITVQTNVPGVKAGDKVTLLCVYKEKSSITSNANLEINTKAIDSLVLGQPLLPNGEKRLTEKTTASYYEIPYSAIQNFTLNGVTTQANAMFEDKAESSLGQVFTLNNFYFTVDKPDVLNAIKVENGKIYVKIAANKSGAVKLSATAMTENGQTTSNNVSTLTINIEAAPQPMSIKLGKLDSTLVMGGTPAKMPVTIYDQYGEVIEPDAFVKTGFVDFVLVSSSMATATVAFDAEGKNLVITPLAVGNTSITVINRNSTKNEIYTAVVNPAAVVTSFNTKLDYSYLVKGATAKLTLETYDQYGNRMKNVAAAYKFKLTPTNGTTLLRLSTNNITVASAYDTPVEFTALLSGRTEIITVTLFNDANNNNVVDNNETIKVPFAFNVYTVAESESLIYSVDPVETVYAAVAQDRSNSGLNMDAFGAVQNQNNKNILYARTIGMKATRTDGTPIALVGNPITAIAATINDNAVDYLGKPANDFIVIGKQWSGTELTKDVNLLVSYMDNAGAIRQTNTKITVSKASLVATSIKFKVNTGKDNDPSNDIEGTVCQLSLSDFGLLTGKRLIENQTLTGIPCYFEVKDQYGVSSINAFNFTVTGIRSAAGTFSFGSDGTITAAKFGTGDTVTISASDTEGNTTSATIKIQ